MKTEHNCWQCKNENLGKCFGSHCYGRNVYLDDNICPSFVDDRNPKEVTFDTIGQIENYLEEYFYMKDFKNIFTRPQLMKMLKLLYPYQESSNMSGLAFSSMCKGRMVKHIEFYIKLHNLKCKTN